jgi:multiple sugar transport system permease protein
MTTLTFSHRHARLGSVALPYLLLAPALLLLIALTFVPLVYSILLSFFEGRLGHGFGSFVGLQNYVSLLTEERFWNAFSNTVVWVFGSVSSQILLGILLAVLLNKMQFARMFFRGALFFPWVMPVAVIAFLWRWILDPQNGILNVSMRSMGFQELAQYPWLTDPETAMGSALIVNAWRGIPFVLVMVLAALQGIPKDEYEAAQLSGAGPLKEFWYVTLPNLRTILATLVLLRIMQISNNFSMMALLTGGGPADSTEILPLLVYAKGFGSHMMGQASALAVLLLLFLVLTAWAYFKLLKEK